MATIIQQLQSTGTGKTISTGTAVSPSKITPKEISTAKVSVPVQKPIIKDYGMGANTEESQKFLNTPKIQNGTTITSNNFTGGQNVYTEQEYKPRDIGIKNFDQALLIAKAIRQQESGGKYAISGGSGESGAFQFMPDTWKAYAKEILGDENAEMSKANQNKVAILKIQKWLNEGKGVEQIAAIWNSGSDKNWEKKIGVNKYGQEYNVPKYVAGVKSILNQLGGNSDFDKRVNDARVLGKTDTEILNKLSESNPKLYDKISSLRGKLGDDREVLNQMSLSYSGNLPTVASVTERVVTEDKQTIDESQFGKVDTGNRVVNAIINNDVLNFLAGGAIQESTEVGKSVGQILALTTKAGQKDIYGAIESQWGLDEQNVKLIRAINENKKAGKDSTRLVNQLISNLQSDRVDMNELVPVLNKTNGQIIAEWAMVGADIITAGKGGKALGSLKKVDDVFDALKVVKNPMVNRMIKNFTLGGTSAGLYEVAMNPESDFEDIAESMIYGGTQNVVFGEILNLAANKANKAILKSKEAKVNKLKESIDITADTITGDIIKGRKKADPIKVKENVVGVISNLGKKDIDTIIKSENPVEEFYKFVQDGRQRYGDIANNIVKNNNVEVTKEEVLEEFNKRFTNQTNKLSDNNPDLAIRKKFLEEDALKLSSGDTNVSRESKALYDYIIREVKDTDASGAYTRVIIGNDKFGKVYALPPGYDMNISLLKSAEKIMTDSWRAVLNKKMTEAVGNVWTNTRKQQGNFEGVSKYLSGTRNANLSNLMALTYQNQLAKRIKAGFTGTKMRGNLLSLVSYPVRLPANIIREAITKDNTTLNKRWSDVFSALKGIREADLSTFIKQPAKNEVIKLDTTKKPLEVEAKGTKKIDTNVIKKDEVVSSKKQLEILEKYKKQHKLDFEVELVNKIFDKYDIEVGGVTYKGKIAMPKTVSDITADHEFTHLVLDNLVGKSGSNFEKFNKKELLLEAKKYLPRYRDRLINEGYNESQWNKEIISMMAEDISSGKKITVTEKLKLFFDKLLYQFKSILKLNKNNKIIDLIDEIKFGKGKNNIKIEGQSFEKAIQRLNNNIKFNDNNTNFLRVYRGDESPIDIYKWDADYAKRVLKESTASSQFEGAGIYFTENIDNAKSYGSNISELEIPDNANILLKESNKKLSRTRVEKILRKSPEIKDVITNWDENSNIGFKMLVDSIMEQENSYEQATSIWAEAFSNSGNEFMKAMSDNGIDGISSIHKSYNAPDKRHYVIYNREFVKPKNIVNIPKSNKIYQRKLSLTNKDDLSYMKRVFNDDTINNFLSGEFKDHRGRDINYFEEVLNANIIK